MSSIEVITSKKKVVSVWDPQRMEKVETEVTVVTVVTMMTVETEVTVVTVVTVETMMTVETEVGENKTGRNWGQTKLSESLFMFLHCLPSAKPGCEFLAV